MASGHVNRINRPNTWLHRPALQREENPCQPGAVHTWHLANIEPASSNVSLWQIVLKNSDSLESEFFAKS
jgi:hypothetical protein